MVKLVFLIDTSSGNLRLLPAETHDVEGGPFPEEWEYRLTLGGPSRTVTYDYVPAGLRASFQVCRRPFDALERQRAG